MELRRRRRIINGLRGGVAALVLVAAPVVAGAQEKFPSRPIEFVVPWGPGGGADQLARLVGKLAEPALGQAMPVINVPGGTGATGMAKLLSAPADGHTAAVYIADAHALLTDPVGARWSMKDITAVAVMVKAPSFLFLAENSRFKSWADFEREAKANPGKLKVATLGFGSVDDFTLNALDAEGVKVVQVPYSKPGERYVSILGGHADALYEQAGDVAPFLSGKQMRPLLVFGRERSPAFPNVPSSYEVGIEVALPQFRAVVVRSGTPPERVKALSDAFEKVAASPDYRKFLQDQFATEDSFMDTLKASQYVAGQLEEMKQAIQRAKTN